jgi:hypothetical protein
MVTSLFIGQREAVPAVVVDRVRLVVLRLLHYSWLTPIGLPRKLVSDG